MTETRAVFVARRGDRGLHVRDIRELLQRAGEVVTTAPGGALDFDDALDQSVRAFQQRRGLVVDGLVGPQTQLALQAARWTLGDRVLQYTSGHLLRGDDVAQLQDRLAALGFPTARVDGVFGVDTDRAVRQFQRGVGLAVDGCVGPDTMRAFDGLRRSVTGGSAHSLRERELVRRSGHSLAGRVVVLDPGHGGHDSGAVANGVVESEVVFDIARRVEGRLSANGVAVVYTRTPHTAVFDDASRAALANDCGADILLSLHCDSAEQADARGIATFYYGHEAVAPDGSTRVERGSAIGAALADLIQRETVARTRLADCRTHARAWTLLQQTRMPAVRIEAGYVSNPSDAARLVDPSFRDAFAEGVVVALQRMYLGDADTAATGVLHLGDLRRQIAELAAG